MLSDALAGRIVGIVAAVHYGGREFGYVGAGSLTNHPALGIAAAHKLTTKLLHHNK